MKYAYIIQCNRTGRRRSYPTMLLAIAAGRRINLDQSSYAIEVDSDMLLPPEEMTA